MKVTRLMPLIYPFICYFVQKRLFGGKSYFVEKRLSVWKLPFRGKTTTPTPSAPEAAGVLNFLCALRPNTPPPNIPWYCWRSSVSGNGCFPIPWPAFVSSVRWPVCARSCSISTAAGRQDTILLVYRLVWLPGNRRKDSPPTDLIGGTPHCGCWET